MNSSHSSLSVSFILLPGFTLFAFSGFIDALRIAGDEADKSQQKECRWSVIAPTLVPVRSSCGVEVMPWKSFAEADKADYVVVIGGQVELERHLDHRIAVYLHRIDQVGQFIVGVCTANFVLARIGLMQNRQCCVHWFHRPAFEVEFPSIPVQSDTIFLEDQQRITCAGGRSAADVAMYLIARHCGASRARKVAAGLVLDQVRNSQSPQPHVEAAWFGEIDDPLVRRAIAMMDRHITKPLTVTNIAQHLQVSENTLYRNFKHSLAVSPRKFLRLMRLAHGHWSLHSTPKSVSQIAHYCQFSDSSHFARLHRASYGVAPGRARTLGPDKCLEAMQAVQSNSLIMNVLSGGFTILG